jgi:hypothetical protein
MDTTLDCSRGSACGICPDVTPTILRTVDGIVTVTLGSRESRASVVSQAAAATFRHMANASLRKRRIVPRETKWRWMLKVL